MLRAWEQTAAAAEYGPLPAGNYKARLTAVELFTAKGKGTPGVKLTLAIVEPAEYDGRKAWHDLWLTAAALPATKRDLAKIGITDPEQLDQPVPEGIILAIRVAVRRDDDGTERNRITRFELDHIEAPAPNPFPEANGDLDDEGEGAPPF
jgi:hypothetical protein